MHSIRNILRKGTVALLLCLLTAAPLSLGVRGAEAIPVAADYTDVKLIPGGMPFGVRFQTEGVSVVGFSPVISGGKSFSPAEDAGIKPKDTLLQINGSPIDGMIGFTSAVEKSGGKPLKILLRRAGEEKTLSMTPLLSDTDGKYKAGVYVRDSGAGIGTVTFIMPGSHAFGGLGHGICDADTGSLVSMSRGSILPVQITGVIKGQAGTPGEIKGSFLPGKIGTLLKNSECGLFGILSREPANAVQAISIGTKNEIREGDATVLSTLEGTEPRAYSIQIYAVNRDADGSKCFSVKINDPALLEASGGIVQGMSGSPILQDGKLVGALTHVLIADPSEGYGIFIENMLAAMPALSLT